MRQGAAKLFSSGKALAKHLKHLREMRRRRIARRKEAGRRSSLGPAARKEVLAKTGSRCHICGGRIAPESRWSADHILSHAQGGKHSLDNYLPAHGICNNYRWSYLPEEFQLIMKLGVWWKTQIEKEDSLALELADRYVRHEQRRASRKVT